MNKILVVCIASALCFSAPVFRDGALISGGEAIPGGVRYFEVLDSFPSGAGYSNGIGCDGAYIWVSETFGHNFRKFDTLGTEINNYNVTRGDRDMTFDGTDLWATHWSSQTVNRYDTSDCSIIASFVPPFGGDRANGLAWDGTHLWVGRESGRIFQMTTAGDTVRSIPPPVYYSYDPRGLAFDGEFLWVGYQSSGLIYKIDTITGAIQEQYAAPGHVPGVNFQQGLDFDGTHLWTTSGGTYNRVYKVRIFAVGIEEQPIPVGAAISIRLAAGANPVSAVSRIAFSIPNPGRVKLEVVDAGGRRVSKLVDQHLPAGDHWRTWCTADLPGGVYFVVLTANDEIKSLKTVKAD